MSRKPVLVFTVSLIAVLLQPWPLVLGSQDIGTLDENENDNLDAEIEEGNNEFALKAIAGKCL